MFNRPVLLAVAVVIGVLALMFSWGVAEQDVDPLKKEQTTPGISYLDILNNPEFRQTMQAAVRDNDQQSIITLQQKALEIATTAGLSETQIGILAGEKGRDFMRFRAKRQLFLAAFEQRYLQLGGIAQLKQAYPEAQDLFERADALISQRDAQILAIAEELADGQSSAAYLAKAKSQWLERANTVTLETPD